MAISQDKWIVYTDGSCLINPGPGGWAAIIKSPQGEKVLHSSEGMTTNNRMELTAALEAIRQIPAGSCIQLFTDSQYLKLGITEWLPGWKKRNWHRKGGTLANIDLWQALDSEVQKHEIQWMWVKGHNGQKENERVDRLSRQAIRSRQ
jgi:ribonuclease HI